MQMCQQLERRLRSWTNYWNGDGIFIQVSVWYKLVYMCVRCKDEWGGLGGCAGLGQIRVAITGSITPLTVN